MATRPGPATKKRTAPDPPPDLSEELFAEVPDEIDDFDVVREVVSRLGEDPVVIKVAKIDDRGVAEYCFQTNDGNLDEAYIQRFYGGGVFQCRILVNGIYRRTVKLNIAEPRQQKDAPPAAGASSSNDSSTMMMLMQMFKIQAESQTRMFEAIMGRGQGDAPQRSEITDLIGGVESLQRLAGGEKKDPTDVFLKGVEFAQKLKGTDAAAGDWKTQLVQVLGDVAPSFAAAFAPRPQQPNANGDHPMGESQQQPKTPEEQEALIKAQMKEGLAFLKKKCFTGTDPQLIIDWIVENAGDYQLVVWTAVNWPIEKFAEVDPDAGTEPFRGWLQSIQNGIARAYQEANSMEPVASGPGGNAGHSGPDGDPGETRPPAGPPDPPAA